MLDKVLLLHMFLYIHLNSKYFIRIGLLSQHHLSKRSFSKNFQKSKKKLIK